MGNCTLGCGREEEPIEIPMAEVQATAEATTRLLVLPKIIVIDENDHEFEIYDPEATPEPEPERPRADVIRELSTIPVRTRPSRKRLMTINRPPPDDSEEAGPSGISLRRASSFSQLTLSSSSRLSPHTALSASSRIVRQQPFDMIVSQRLNTSRTRLNRESENAERLRDYLEQFHPSGLRTPEEMMFSPDTPVERYKFHLFKETCKEAKERRRSWW